MRTDKIMFLDEQVRSIFDKITEITGVDNSDTTSKK